MSTPSAFYDTLVLGEKLTHLAQGFSKPEVHLLCYAGCLLALYDGRPYTDWDYEFVSATSDGLPFAQDVEEAIDESLELGLVEAKDTMFHITEFGVAELALQRGLTSNLQRDRYLVGSSDALLVLSLGNIREAFDYDPSISFLKQGNRTEWLLDQPNIDRLYGNFEELKKVLAYDVKDLSVPLVTWLKYLIHSGSNILEASHPPAKARSTLLLNNHFFCPLLSQNVEYFSNSDFSGRLRPRRIASLPFSKLTRLGCFNLARPTNAKKGFTSKATHLAPSIALSTGVVPEPLKGSIIFIREVGLETSSTAPETNFALNPSLIGYHLWRGSAELSTGVVMALTL